MEKHILLDKAYSYDYKDAISSPEGCEYDRIGGFWRNSKNGEIMMLGKNPINRQSKKCDIETGEDQKGE